MAVVPLLVFLTLQSRKRLEKRSKVRAARKARLAADDPSVEEGNSGRLALPLESVRPCSPGSLDSPRPLQCGLQAAMWVCALRIQNCSQLLRSQGGVQCFRALQLPCSPGVGGGATGASQSMCICTENISGKGHASTDSWFCFTLRAAAISLVLKLTLPAEEHL